MESMAEVVSNLVRAPTENFLWYRGVEEGVLIGRRPEGQRQDIEILLQSTREDVIGFQTYLPDVRVTKKNRKKLENFIRAIDLSADWLWSARIGSGAGPHPIERQVFFYYKWVCPNEGLSQNEIRDCIDLISGILFDGCERLLHQFQWIAAGKISVDRALNEFDFDIYNEGKEWGNA